jgi:hypothetical protein
MDRLVSKRDQFRPDHCLVERFHRRADCAKRRQCFRQSATQTYYDSGFSLASLAAGDYLFTVATFANFAPGPNIANGFAYDNDAPIPLAVWCQPASHCDMGTYWSVWLDGVDRADPPNPTPEPASLALFGLALAGLALRHKRS